MTTLSKINLIHRQTRLLNSEDSKAIDTPTNTTIQIKQKVGDSKQSITILTFTYLSLMHLSAHHIHLFHLMTEPTYMSLVIKAYNFAPHAEQNTPFTRAPHAEQKTAFSPLCST